MREGSHEPRNRLKGGLEAETELKEPGALVLQPNGTELCQELQSAQKQSNLQGLQKEMHPAMF